LSMSDRKIITLYIYAKDSDGRYEYLPLADKLALIRKSSISAEQQRQQEKLANCNHIGGSGCPN
jgi:hypothetical protein